MFIAAYSTFNVFSYLCAPKKINEKINSKL